MQLQKISLNRFQFNFRSFRSQHEIWLWIQHWLKESEIWLHWNWQWFQSQRPRNLDYWQKCWQHSSFRKLPSKLKMLMSEQRSCQEKKLLRKALVPHWRPSLLWWHWSFQKRRKRGCNFQCPTIDWRGNGYGWLRSERLKEESDEKQRKEQKKSDLSALRS